MNKRFPTYRRALTALFSVVLLAAACSGGSDPDTEATTTVAPSSTTPRSTTTTTTPPDGPIEPLTGVPIGDNDEVLERPAVVVKINNNDASARNALVGVDRADIIYEERIEGNATRFAAVFHSDLPDYVGSVRSGRTSDIDLVSNLRTPLFMYSGSNTGVARQLRDAEGNGVLVRIAEDLGNRDVMFRDPPGSTRVTSLRANPEEAAKSYADGTAVPEPIFQYLRTDEEFSAGDAAGGVLLDSVNAAVFVWDRGEGHFVRYQTSSNKPIETATPVLTTDDDPLAFENVVVLFVNYTRSPIDRESVDAQTVGQGDALILSNGQMVTGTWARPFAPGGFSLFDADGTELELSPGKTWVSLSPVGEAELWDPADAAEFLASQSG